nr:hypothetical protein [Haladaptatus pallidirubidus]
MGETRYRLRRTRTVDERNEWVTFVLNRANVRDVIRNPQSVARVERVSSISSENKVYPDGHREQSEVPERRIK